MAKREPRRRAATRAATLGARRLARDREQLARIAEGGSPERPIVVESPAEVEVVAAAPCPLCDAAVRVVAHDAVTIDGERLRVARTACSGCRAERSIYVALRPIALH